MSFSLAVRQQIALRDRGRCFRCGHRAQQIHHRKPRGMGGSKDPQVDQPANGILLCGVGGTDGCHGWVESHREEAYALGFLVRRGEEPSSVPVLKWGQNYYLLDNAGTAHLSPR